MLKEVIGIGFGIKLKVWGDYACFTRPEFKVERTVEIYLVNGVEIPVVLYAVNLPYLQEKIDAQETADGKQNDDHCGIIQYWEKLANVVVKRRK